MLAPRQFGRAMLEPEDVSVSRGSSGEVDRAAASGELQGVPEATCFGKSTSAGSMATATMSPRKIGAVSKSVWKDFFSAIRPPPKPFGNASR